MTEKYPRIKELGLYAYNPTAMNNRPHVSADDLERILESGLRVCANDNKELWSVGNIDEHDDFTGYIINIKPIAKPDPREAKIKALKEQVESILKELESLR